MNPSVIDYLTIQVELDKPYPEKAQMEIKSTTKKCSRCNEELCLDKFGKNKNKEDVFDIRCKKCYKIAIYKDGKNKERGFDYYEKNREKFIKQKSIWNKENKDKVNSANRRSYVKAKNNVM